MNQRMDTRSAVPGKGPVDNSSTLRDPEIGRTRHSAVNHAPDPEVVVKPQRRTFTAEYKQRILDAADACKHGELGALLRHEGLAYSTVSKWRDARDAAILKALTAGKPGPVAMEPNPLEEENAELRRELERVRAELTKAHVIIDVQKKVSELLAQGSLDGNGETF